MCPAPQAGNRLATRGAAWLRVLSLGILAAAAPCARAATPPPVVFRWFEYTGRDPVFSPSLPAGSFRNPVLAGFYPDPDICRVGSDYYLVNSSFSYFPGIPVFHSQDLVNWAQVGNVVDRPGQLNYRGLGVSRGIFAPSLSHHDGVFYLVCTFADAGGNFVMTAPNPAGPWSDPVWLGFDGVDPSLFFDDDGRAWIVNNGGPPDEKPLYIGHRAIWMQEFDVRAKKLIGPRGIIVNGGVHPSDHPVWIEGPHLLKKDGWYYLICAEGGTAEDHSEVVFRSQAVMGPYLPGPSNPILTQRTLPATRPNPVTCTGHAEFVQAPDSGWWAVFLGCRPYRGKLFNTGRETFMLPVTWRDGWPTILPDGAVVPFTVPSPLGANPDPARSAPLTGNFTWRDDFRGPALSRLWLGLRGLPGATLGASGTGGLSLAPGADPLWGNGRPAYLGRRLQHAHFTATTSLTVPVTPGISAGLAIFQNETHHYFFAVHQAPGRMGVEAYVERLDGRTPEKICSLLIGAEEQIELRITGDDARCDFSFSAIPGSWHTQQSVTDATLLSTQVAGGFVGATVGVHARID